MLARDVAEDVEHADIVAADPKHAAEERLGFGQAARREMLLGEIEAGGGGQCIHDGGRS